ncbi:hypothetical protein [Yoonia sp.]|uniref:hypothetical protein n=1 Tax=Yoonia sp. TaxID=2212373 RepID=UPI0023B70A15
MSVKEINRVLETCLKDKGSYVGLVHSLFELGCSDQLIKAIVVGAMGQGLKDRVQPLIDMVRTYESLSSSEQIDLLYSIVEKRDAQAQSEALDKKMSA